MQFRDYECPQCSNDQFSIVLSDGFILMMTVHAILSPSIFAREAMEEGFLYFVATCQECGHVVAKRTLEAELQIEGA